MFNVSSAFTGFRLHIPAVTETGTEGDCFLSELCHFVLCYYRLQQPRGRQLMGAGSGWLAPVQARSHSQALLLVPVATGLGRKLSKRKKKPGRWVAAGSDLWCGWALWAETEWFCGKWKAEKRDLPGGLVLWEHWGRAENGALLQHLFLGKGQAV